MKILVDIKVEKETLERLNMLLLENPLLKQGGNNYDDLMKLLIKRYVEKMNE
jgi:hypothetical protein